MRFIRVSVDFLCVLIFVTIGRHTHDHGLSLGGIALTTWPFAIGLLTGWGIITLLHRSGESVADGGVVAAITVAVGMILRVIAGQGTAFAFVVVALLFLSAFMAGWRLVGAKFRH